MADRHPELSAPGPATAVAALRYRVEAAHELGDRANETPAQPARLAETRRSRLVAFLQRLGLG